MKISLVIHEIVVDGAALSHRERAQLAEATGQQLTRLIHQRLRQRPSEAPVRTELSSQIAAQVLAALPNGTFATGPARTPSPARAPGPGPVTRGRPR